MQYTQYNRYESWFYETKSKECDLESLLLSLVTYHYHLSLTTLTVTILKCLQLITGEFSEEYQK